MQYKLAGKYSESEINNIAHQLSASGNYQKYTDNKQSKFIFYKTIEVLNTPITIIKTVPLTNAYESIFQIVSGGRKLMGYIVYFRWNFI